MGVEGQTKFYRCNRFVRVHDCARDEAENVMEPLAWFLTRKTAAAEACLVHEIDEPDTAFIEGVMTGGLSRSQRLLAKLPVHRQPMGENLAPFAGAACLDRRGRTSRSI